MESVQNEEEFIQWYSTYGLITAEDLLSKYQISLPQSQLSEALSKPSSFYHQLIQLPLKNVLNGIIMQQAEDYHVYAQKLFIDYLLSPSGGAPEEAQGQSTRESLEMERVKLMSLGKSFNQLQLDNATLIAQSQSQSTKLMALWRVEFDKSLESIKKCLSQEGHSIKPSLVRQAINQVLIAGENPIEPLAQVLQLSFDKKTQEQLTALLNPLLEKSLQFKTDFLELFKKSADVNKSARQYRTLFHDAIVKTTELLQVLPDYKINETKDMVNRELLYFDRTIGEGPIA